MLRFFVRLAIALLAEKIVGRPRRVHEIRLYTGTFTAPVGTPMPLLHDRAWPHPWRPLGK